MTLIYKTAAQKRYLKRMVLVAIFYLAATALAAFTLTKDEPVTWLTVVLAIPPGLGIIGFIWALARLIIEEQDEFMRMLIVRQWLIATGLAMSLAAIWGFLEQFEVVWHVDAYWWPIIWFFGFGVGAISNRIQYGTWGTL